MWIPPREHHGAHLQRNRSAKCVRIDGPRHGLASTQRTGRWPFGSGGRTATAKREAQMPVDTTLVCTEKVVQRVAQMRKECTCPELVGSQRHAQFVVVAAEIEDRGSEAIGRFLNALAVARTRCELLLMGKRRIATSNVVVAGSA